MWVLSLYKVIFGVEMTFIEQSVYFICKYYLQVRFNCATILFDKWAVITYE